MEQKEAIKELKKMFIKADYKAYTILRSVSSSGMSRRISVFVILNNKPICLDWYIEQLDLYKRHIKHEGLKVGGCGMDMGFSVVYNLSSMLYPKGFKIRKDDRNRNAINGSKPTDKDYNWDNDGGYRLSHEWI